MAVSGVNLQIARGNIHALIGPERRRQDHLLQPAHQVPQADARPHPLSGPRHHGAPHPPTGWARPGPLVSNFQHGEVRKHRRNLERTHQAEPRHVGRRQRCDIRPVVENLAGRGLEKLGQQVEAGGLAGAVGADQGMDAAAANPQIDVANGEESRRTPWSVPGSRE